MPSWGLSLAKKGLHHHHHHRRRRRRRRRRHHHSRLKMAVLPPC